MSSLRIALFDCDGTLVDSQHHIVSAMNVAFQEAGLPEPDPAAVRAIIGLPLEAGIAQILPATEPADWRALAEGYRRAARIQQQESVPEPLFPGIGNALDALDAHGFLLGIVTGKGRRGLDFILQHHGIHHRFVTLQTADVGPGKPHPGMVFRALAESGVDAENSVVIGDTTFDIHMARNANVSSVGVTWGYHAPDMLTGAGADRLVHSCADIPDAVLSLAGLARTTGA